MEDHYAFLRNSNGGCVNMRSKSRIMSMVSMLAGLILPATTRPNVPPKDLAETPIPKYVLEYGKLSELTVITLMPSSTAGLAI